MRPSTVFPTTPSVLKRTPSSSTMDSSRESSIVWFLRRRDFETDLFSSVLLPRSSFPSGHCKLQATFTFIRFFLRTRPDFVRLRPSSNLSFPFLRRSRSPRLLPLRKASPLLHPRTQSSSMARFLASSRWNHGGGLEDEWVSFARTRVVLPFPFPLADLLSLPSLFQWTTGITGRCVPFSLSPKLSPLVLLLTLSLSSTFSCRTSSSVPFSVSPSPSSPTEATTHLSLIDTLTSLTLLESSTETSSPRRESNWGTDRRTGGTRGSLETEERRGS